MRHLQSGNSIAIGCNANHLISLGQLAGFSKMNKFGRNADVDSAATETVWGAGGAYTFPTEAKAMTIVSSDGDDAAADTGAITVQITGLNAAYEEISQTVTLTGATPVNIPISLIRVYRVKVLTAGSTGTNEGVLTVASGGTTYATVEALAGQTLMAVYTVPAGKSGLLCEAYATCNKIIGTAGSAIIELKAREFGGAIRTIHVEGIGTNGTSTMHKDWEIPELLPEKTDIWINATVAADNHDISAGFSIVLIDN